LILYFDASALVKKYVEEEGSELVRKELIEGRAATSRLSEVEIASALTRRWREGGISRDDLEEALVAVQDDFGALMKVELSPAVTSLARELLLKHPLRAGDAIQLASCLFLRNRGLDPKLFAFDGKLNSVAETEGLKLGVLENPTK
jgi:hypothetical protein